MSPHEMPDGAQPDGRQFDSVRPESVRSDGAQSDSERSVGAQLGGAQPDPLQQARDWLRQQIGRPLPAAPDSVEDQAPPQVQARDGAAGPYRKLPDLGDPDADPSALVRDGGDGAQRAKPDPGGPDADPSAVARDIVVRKLAAQDRTRQELAKALANKNVPEQAARDTLDRFEEIGLIDDGAFARRWVESRQVRRHRSRLALRRELADKGVERSVVDQAMSQVSSDDELSAAQAYVDKTANSMAGLDPLVRRRRLADRLARRGFGADIIGRVLKDSQTR